MALVFYLICSIIKKSVSLLEILLCSPFLPDTGPWEAEHSLVGEARAQRRKRLRCLILLTPALLPSWELTRKQWLRGFPLWSPQRRSCLGAPPSSSISHQALMQLLLPLTASGCGITAPRCCCSGELHHCISLPCEQAQASLLEKTTRRKPEVPFKTDPC